MVHQRYGREKGTSVSLLFFRSLVNWIGSSKIRKLVGIVQTLNKKDDKPYLLFNLETTDGNSLEVINVQSAINNTYRLEL